MAEKTVLIRNLTSNPLNLRLGSKGSPYYLDISSSNGEGGLARRGEQGDIVEVPEGLTKHPSYTKSVNRLFEEITQQEADSIQATQYGSDGQDEHRYNPNIPDDAERLRAHTVAKIDERLNPDGDRGWQVVAGKNNRLAAQRPFGDLERLRSQGVGNVDVTAVGPQQVTQGPPPGPKTVRKNGR
jgi:hypothetical protein